MTESIVCPFCSADIYLKFHNLDFDTIVCDYCGEEFTFDKNILNNLEGNNQGLVIQNIEAKIKKLQQIMKVSDSLEISRLAGVLGMEEQALWEKIFEWAEKFGFRIKKNVVIFQNGDTEGFIESLDKQFVEWEQKEKNNTGKI